MRNNEEDPRMNILEENLDLIRKIAWAYVNEFPGLEFDDLFEEGCLAVIVAQKMPGRYDPSKGSVSNYIYHIVHNHLRKMLKSGKGKREAEIPLSWNPEDEETMNPEQEIISREEWERFLSSLSDEAKAICSIIFEESDIYLPSDKPKICRGEITKALRDREWSWGKIWGGYREIRLALSQIR
jgi:RNA polymerase sigma factor (sigma-70 family)